MATGTLCVVCKVRPPEDQVSVGFTQSGHSVMLYRHRLGAVLELELSEHDLSGRCLCIRCADRLNKIEQLRKMQEVFKQQFLSAEPQVSSGHSRTEEEIPKVFDKRQAEVTEIICTDSRTETGATTGAMSPGHAAMKPLGASSAETYCSVCNTTLATPRGLRLHQRIHNDAASKVCKVCGRALTSASSLTLHIQQEHGTLRLYQCKMCSYTSTSPASMRTHTKRKHTDKKPDFIYLLSDIPEWPESQAAVARLQRESLTTPRRSNRKQGYKCMKCTLTFAGVAALKEHMVSVHCLPLGVERGDNKEGHKPGTSVLDRDDGSKSDVNHSEVVLTIKQELPMSVNNDVLSAVPSDDTHSSKNGDISDSSVTEDSEVLNHSHDYGPNPADTVQTLKENSPVSDEATNHLHKGETDNGVDSDDVKVYKSNDGPQFGVQGIIVSGEATKKSNRGKRHHTAVCPHCTRTFRHEVQLVDHIRDHTEGKILQCTVCQIGFKQQVSLHTHMLKHSGLYPHRCPDCGKGFAHAWALRNHAAVHSKATPYQCRHCPVHFTTLHQRRMHCRRQHMQKQEEAMKVSKKKDTTFTCPTCDKTFHRKLNLTAHLETHNITKTAECQLCMKKFKGKSQLASHMHWHRLQLKKVKGQKFLCEECGKSYKNMKGLRDHIRCHRGDRTFSCTICQLVVPNQSRLQNHMDTVHSEEKPYKCDLCEKSFVYKISYDAHCNMHKDLRPFLCSTCGKGFRTRPHLKEHMNVHYQTKSFLCNQCSATFMWRAQLIRHKNSVHADPNVPKAPTVKRGPRKKPASHGQASESCPGLATLEAMSTAPLDSSVIVSPLGPAVTVTPLEPAVRVNPLEPDVRVSPLVMEPPMMVRPMEHTQTINPETGNTETPPHPTVTTLTEQVTEDSRVMLPPDSAGTFIQLNGSMVRGQLLQNMPIQAFLQQHQSVAGRTTYVIRPSHMGLVAEVVPEGQHLQQQQQQQVHQQQPQQELQQQQQDLQQQCYQPQQQQ